MKYDFHRHYPGPRGSHLNCLTSYTRTKERKETGTMKPGKKVKSHKAKDHQEAET